MKTGTRNSATRSVFSRPAGGTLLLVIVAVLVIAGSAGVSQADLMDGLFLHWTFDDADVSGTTLSDTSGSSTTYNGTIGGSPTTGASGLLGEAFDFYGNTGYVSGPNVRGTAEEAPFQFNKTYPSGTGTDLAYSFWYTRRADDAGNLRILSTQAGHKGTMGYAFWASDTTSQLSLCDDNEHRRGGATAQVADGLQTSTADEDKWIHVVLNFDTSEENVEAFVNGTSVYTHDYSNFNDEGWVTYALNLGRAVYPGVTAYHQGKIDELGGWQRQLSQSEISALYNNGDGMVIPEPASGALLVLLGGLAWFVRRKVRA